MESTSVEKVDPNWFSFAYFFYILNDKLYFRFFQK